MKKRSLLTLCLAALASILLVSCGGGGGDSSLLPESITGATFTVAAGETRRIETETIIDVTESATIAGTIELAPGASLTVVAPDITILGTVQAAPTRARSISRSRAPRPPMVYVAGARVNFSGKIDLPPATDLVFASLNHPILQSNLTISGSIKTNGEDAKTRGVNGIRSGSILIGTREARELGKTRYQDSPITALLGVTQTHILTITGTITIGKGGDGFSDTTGVLAGKTLTITGSDGERSGDLECVADEIDIAGSTITTGDGGNGGSATISSELQRTLDGKQAGEQGVDVVGTAGNSETAGLVAILSSSAVVGGPSQGKHGRNGSLSLRAGNGGPGGRGGSVTAFAGQELLEGRYRGFVSLGAGSGGSTESIGTNGGDGGNVILRNKRGTDQAILSLPPEISFARGGAGYDGCTIAPVAAGTEGGKGGNVDTKGLEYILLSGTKNDGGTGGNGAPPGMGGQGGVDDTSKSIGSSGLSGRPCGGGTTTWDGPGFYPIKVGRTAGVSYKSSPLNLDFTIRTDAKTVLATSGISAYPAINIVSGKKSTANYSDNAEDGSTRIWGSASYDSNENIIQTVVYTPAITIPQGLTVNAPVTQTITQTIYNGSGTPPTGQFKVKVTLLGFEDIVTPLGNLKNCAKVATEYASLAGVVSDTQTTWFAPGKGQVKWSYEKSGSSQVWNSITDP